MRAPPGEVRDGARHAQNPVVRARREKQPRERVAQKLVALPVGVAMAVDLARPEQRVRLALPLELHCRAASDPRFDGAGGFAGHGRDELAFARRRHFELDVDAVGERPGDAATVARDALGRAAAAAAAVAAMAAGAGIHGRDELEARRETAPGARRARSTPGRSRAARAALRARHGRIPAARPGTAPRDARARSPPGRGSVAAADERGAGGAVVRSAKRPLAPARGLEAGARHRMDGCDLQRLGLG